MSFVSNEYLSNPWGNLFRIACRSDATVLLTGPTGSGKSWLAKRIHDGGARRLKPFITVNLATLHEGTLESELFGHERGAFTSADSKRVGRLELAHGGTVFLDEIGELPPRLQARLLEFLQSKTIIPVGGTREVRLDVRVIAATHRDLEKSVAAGTFREDLFHRLRVLCLELRPLRERPEEFDSLVHSCLEDACRQNGKSVLRLSEAVASRLESYPWPGNVRELRNVLEFSVLSADGPVIELTDLPAWFRQSEPSARTEAMTGILGTSEIPLTLDYESTRSRFEREYFEKALKRFQWRISRTAREIGMSKTTLLRRLKEHGIETELAVG